MTIATVEAASIEDILSEFRTGLEAVVFCNDCLGPARPICGRPCKNIPAKKHMCSWTLDKIEEHVRKGNKTTIKNLRKWYSTR